LYGHTPYHTFFDRSHFCETIREKEQKGELKVSLQYSMSNTGEMMDIARKGATVEKVLILLMCLLIGGFFIRLDGGRLLNGGLYMLQEKPADAISHRGVIEKIVPCDQYHFPNISKYHKEYSNVNNTSIYGYEITVDNMDFKAPEIGTLTQGDAVVICFLPKSGYILSVEKETPEN